MPRTWHLHMLIRLATCRQRCSNCSHRTSLVSSLPTRTTLGISASWPSDNMSARRFIARHQPCAMRESQTTRSTRSGSSSRRSGRSSPRTASDPSSTRAPSRPTPVCSPPRNCTRVRRSSTDPSLWRQHRSITRTDSRHWRTTASVLRWMTSSFPTCSISACRRLCASAVPLRVLLRPYPKFTAGLGFSASHFCSRRCSPAPIPTG
jgi:hypothetical protein